MASATDAGGVARAAANQDAAPAADPASVPAVPAFEPLEIAIGIGGIAALALFAGYVLLHVRRRGLRANPAETRDELPAGPTSAEQQATAALHRRKLRRARMRLEEDPIIASMGVSSTARREPGVSRAKRSARRSPPT